MMHYTNQYVFTGWHLKIQFTLIYKAENIFREFFFYTYIINLNKIIMISTSIENVLLYLEYNNNTQTF